MAIKLSHRGICVSDFKQSLRFYRDALGFAEAEHFAMADPALSSVMEVEGAQISAQMVRNEQGVTLELLQFMTPSASGPRERRPNNQYGLTHLAFYVDDMKETAARVLEAGGKVYEHTRATFTQGQTTMIYCTDPDGVRVGAVHHPLHCCPPVYR